ncbi:MAG: DNA-directed RNA polymerase subunit beta', partial [Bdellovibrionales bacterium]|nr:DNA-directed RNA polymerase subunit beta' [Bdellovibrionales bacterium]
MTALLEGGEVIESLGDRILGRVALDDIVDSYTNEVLVEMNEAIDEERVEKIMNAGFESVTMRSVLSCEARHGVCVLCYGRDLARGTMTNIGEAVGVIAAQSIGEPGTQLTMRTFHIGGAATRAAEQSTLDSRNDGFLHYDNIVAVKREIKDHTGTHKDVWIVMNRNGDFVLRDGNGRERERYRATFGAHVHFPHGEFVKAGTIISSWDPY